MRFTAGVGMLLLGVSGLLLQGCTTIYEGKYEYGRGWREAEVVKVSTASEMKSRTSSIAATK